MRYIVIFLLCMTIKAQSSRAQSHEAQQLLLNVEKLAQLKAILKNMHEGYRIVSTGYNTIKDLSQGNYKLHHVFLDALLQVSPAVKRYWKIADIVKYQKAIFNEQEKAYNYFQGAGSFTAGEIRYIRRVYDNLVHKCLKNIEELLMVITANKLRMNDDERLAGIDRIFQDIQDKFSFLKSFNSSTKLLSAQRLTAQSEIDIARTLSDID